ncbi:MAG TPA: hypothetical protein VGC77_08935 [Rhodopseudomonas sp.]
MEHSDFTIGLEFLTETGRWRCTDVGTRTIAAIRLDLDHDPRWYEGPPYAIVERVFDEEDIAGCRPAPSERGYDDSGKSRLMTVERDDVAAVSPVNKSQNGLAGSLFSLSQRQTLYP